MLREFRGTTFALGKGPKSAYIHGFRTNCLLGLGVGRGMEWLGEGGSQEIGDESEGVMEGERVVINRGKGCCS